LLGVVNIRIPSLVNILFISFRYLSTLSGSKCSITWKETIKSMDEFLIGRLIADPIKKKFLLLYLD